MKQCKLCKKTKYFSDFYKQSKRKASYHPNCKSCFKEKSLEGYRKNREKRLLQMKQWDMDNFDNTKERRSLNSKEWFSKNRKLKLEQSRQHHVLNKEYRNSKSKEHYKNNREYYNFKKAKYRAKKLSATVPGYEEELKEIYKNCPEGYEVDHIITLQGKNVSGLHIPCNLQYLTIAENRKKGNKIEDLDG